MTNSSTEFADSPYILLLGSNTTVSHPVIALRIKAAAARGATLVVVDPRRIGMAHHATIHLPIHVGTDLALLNAMAHVIIEEGLEDREFVAARTENFGALAATVREYPPERAERICGVSADLIRQVARGYAGAERAAIVYTLGITEHACGTANVWGLTNLALLTGNVGKRGAGVNPLRGQNNVQGTNDMGALPDMYVGYQRVDDPLVRARFEKVYGRSLNPEPGRTFYRQMGAMRRGEQRALICEGENPLLSEPEAEQTLKALERLDFLMVQDIFLTETAALADVVLPAAAWAEKDGTFTNTDRRVQRVRRAVAPPGQALPDWEITCALAERMGYEGMRYSGPEQVWDEIRSLSPYLAGVTYARIEKTGLQWPCPDEAHPGTDFMYEHEFARPNKRGLFQAVHFQPPTEGPDEAFPLTLTTGRQLEHYHTGTQTRRSLGVDGLRGEELVEISPADAKRLGVLDGDWVQVQSRRGQVEARAQITGRSPAGTVFMSFHFRETPTNLLTIDSTDPIVDTAELKACAVRVTRLSTHEWQIEGAGAERELAPAGDV